ncbi:MAG: hypothetical protein SNI45_04525 [Rikenellaceae bacterium]
MKRELTTDEIQLFARIKKLDFDLITKLKEFLGATKVRNTNIRYEYRVRTKECVMCGRMTSYYLWSKYDGRCKRCA